MRQSDSSSNCILTSSHQHYGKRDPAKEERADEESLMGLTTMRTHLSSDGVRTSGEELRNASSLHSTLGETDGSTKARASSSDDNGVVLVVNHFVCSSDVGLLMVNDQEFVRRETEQCQSNRQDGKADELGTRRETKERTNLLGIGGVLRENSARLSRAVQTLNRRRKT